MHPNAYRRLDLFPEKQSEETETQEKRRDGKAKAAPGRGRGCHGESTGYHVSTPDWLRVRRGGSCRAPLSQKLASSTLSVADRSVRSLDRCAGCSTEFLMRAVQHIRDGPRRSSGAIGYKKLSAWLCTHALEGLGRGDDRLGHSHPFENLVLNSARDPQRSVTTTEACAMNGRVSATRPVTCTSGASASLIHLPARICADNVELRRIGALSQEGHHLAGEPGHRVDIRPVIHGSREHDAWGRVGNGLSNGKSGEKRAKSTPFSTQPQRSAHSGARATKRRSSSSDTKNVRSKWAAASARTPTVFLLHVPRCYAVAIGSGSHKQPTFPRSRRRPYRGAGYGHVPT